MSGVFHDREQSICLSCDDRGIIQEFLDKLPEVDIAWFFKVKGLYIGLRIKMCIKGVNPVSRLPGGFGCCRGRGRLLCRIGGGLLPPGRGCCLVHVSGCCLLRARRHRSRLALQRGFWVDGLVQLVYIVGECPGDFCPDAGLLVSPFPGGLAVLPAIRGKKKEDADNDYDQNRNEKKI